MEAVELEAYLEREFPHHKVTSTDGLPAIGKRPEGLIVNRDPTYRPGTHWVSFYLPREGQYTAHKFW